VIDIPPQKEIKSITTLNFFPIVRITFIMTSIKYIVTKDGFLCSFSGTGEKTGGTYSGEVDISRAGGGGIEVSGE
jgi:hypothetical protein